jgi:hypothetical protein
LFVILISEARVMHLQNPFEILLDRLEAIQTKIGDIDTIVRSGNVPPIRRIKKKSKHASAIQSQNVVKKS